MHLVESCWQAALQQLPRCHCPAPACQLKAIVWSAVGQFRDLVESCARDVQLQETLRKVLAFTARGWDAARQHALRAVQTDNRMRIWCADDAMTLGLLFRCALGRVDIHNPVGELPGLGCVCSGPVCDACLHVALLGHLHCRSGAVSSRWWPILPI